MTVPEAGGLDRLAALVAPVCPRLSDLLRRSAERTVGDHAAALWADPPRPRHPLLRRARRHLEAELRAALGARLPAAEAEEAAAAFERHPVLQTADHAQLLLDPVAFHTNLVFHLGARRAGARYLFVNACSTITLESRRGEGPGWLPVEGRRVRVFDLPRSRLTGQSVCGAPGPLRFAFRPDPGPPLDAELEEALERLRRDLGGEELPSAAEAFARANERLWRDWGPAQGTRLAFTDDRLTAAVVARNLEDEESALSRLLFDPALREPLLAGLARAKAEGAGRLALRETTRFFWRLREGRVRPLALAGGRLVEPGAPSAAPVPFERRAVAALLRSGALYPDLCVGFLAIAVLPRVRALGGSSQMIYLPVIARALGWTLEAAGGDLAAAGAEAATLEDGWIAGVVEGTAHPLRSLAAAPRGGLLGAQEARWAQVPIRESVGRGALYEYLGRWTDVLGRSA